MSRSMEAGVEGVTSREIPVAMVITLGLMGLASPLKEAFRTLLLLVTMIIGDYLNCVCMETLCFKMLT